MLKHQWFIWGITYVCRHWESGHTPPPVVLLMIKVVFMDGCVLVCLVLLLREQNSHWIKQEPWQKEKTSERNRKPQVTNRIINLNPYWRKGAITLPYKQMEQLNELTNRWRLNAKPPLWDTFLQAAQLQEQEACSYVGSWSTPSTTQLCFLLKSCFYTFSTREMYQSLEVSRKMCLKKEV